MLDSRWPVLWTGLSLLGVYLVHTLRRWRYLRLKQFADFPQPAKPSFIWGHMALLDKLIKKGDPRRHIGGHHQPLITHIKTLLTDSPTDQVLLEASREQGNPPVILLDLRPIEYPMLVVCNYEVAEQITKTSPRYSSSAPKSLTLRDLGHLTGKTSILTQEVNDINHYLRDRLVLTRRRVTSGKSSESV